MGGEKVHSIIHFVIELFMKYLDRGVDKKPKKINNKAIVLRMNGLYKIIGYFYIIVILALSVIAFVNGAFLGEDMPLIASLLGIFMALGLFLVLVGENVKVIATPCKMIYTGIIGTRQEIVWSEVTSVRLNKRTKDLIVSDHEKKIKLHLHLVGIARLIELIKENVNPWVYAECLDELHEVGIKIKM